MPLTTNAWNFVKDIEEAEDEGAVLRLLLNRAGAHGFRWAFAGLVPKPTIKACDIGSHILFQEFPGGWAARYNTENYALRDPVVHHLRRTHSPLTWEDSYTADSRRDEVKLIRGEAAAFSLRSGYVIPVNLVGNLVAAVSFGSDGHDLDPAALSELAFTAHFAIGHLFRLRYEPNNSPGLVSPRERECILWASDGKTDWEISVILGISRPTVVKHLLSARAKLAAVNRTHLIGEAIRKKLIR